MRDQLALPGGLVSPAGLEPATPCLEQLFPHLKWKVFLLIPLGFLIFRLSDFHRYFTIKTLFSRFLELSLSRQSNAVRWFVNESHCLACDPAKAPERGISINFLWNLNPLL
jgi:hypothetical protein